MASKLAHHLAAVRRARLTGVYEYRHHSGKVTRFSWAEAAPEFQEIPSEYAVLLGTPSPPAPHALIALRNEHGALFYEAPAGFDASAIQTRADLVAAIQGQRPREFIWTGDTVVAEFYQHQFRR